MNLESTFQLLIDRLPDNNPGIILTGSQTPENIIASIESNSKSHNSLLLVNYDVFRYANSKILQDYILADNRNYFISTFGYENKIIAPRMFELSFPIFYFVRSSQALSLKEHNLPYGFSCLNNREGFHRLILGYYAYKAGLLDQMLFTQNLTGCWPAGYEQVLLNSLEDFEEYKKLLPIISNQDHQHGDRPTHKAYKEAYCNIVTESETECFMIDQTFPTPVVTEKSYRPFISCQIPLFLAPQGHLKYLKGLGFELMEDLLPIGYDKLDTFEKAKAIVQIVSKGKDFIENFYFDHLLEITHNHELVSSKKVDQLILDRIGNFVSNI